VKQLLGQFISEQFLRFLVAGAIAAAVNFSVGFCLSGLLPFHGDIIAGHLSGMVVAFILFGRKVFEDSTNTQTRKVFIFVAVNAAALAQTYLVYYVLIHLVFVYTPVILYPDVIARAIAIITPIFTSFLGHKYFTFRQ
jgi:putative flippase GtrA